MKTVLALWVILGLLIYGIWYISIRDIDINNELTTSEGVYVGQVLEIHKDGILYKTYDGSISVGVNNITNKVIKRFTVYNLDTLKCIKDNIGKDSLVKLEYKVYAFLPIRYSSKTQILNCVTYKDK